MLEIDIKKKLRDFDLEVNIEIEKGEILMLVGDNGCGKTTLLNLVVVLLKPDEGTIKLDGRSLFDSSLKIDVIPEKRDIGYVFQNYALFPHMSVYIMWHSACALASFLEEISTRSLKIILNPLGYGRIGMP